MLPRAGFERLRQLAHDALPAESCALLVGVDAASGRVVTDVEAVGQGSATAYEIPARAFHDIEAVARERGAFVCGVFHSHPASGALPSGRDLELAWPGLDYLILDARTDELRAWRLAEDRSGFVASGVTVQDA